MENREGRVKKCNIHSDSEDSSSFSFIGNCPHMSQKSRESHSALLGELGHFFL